MTRLQLTIALAYELGGAASVAGAEGAEVMHRITDIEDADVALRYLILWRQRKVVPLTEAQYDYLFGLVTDELSMLNDERYRLSDD